MRLSRISSPNALFLAAVCIYLAASLIMLSHYPPLGVDEGWFANPAYNLATKGFLGATLMSGFYCTEHHSYWMPPFHLLLLAVPSHPNGAFFAPVLLFVTWFSPFSTSALGAHASCLLPPATGRGANFMTAGGFLIDYWLKSDNNPGVLGQMDSGGGALKDLSSCTPFDQVDNSGGQEV